MQLKRQAGIARQAFFRALLAMLLVCGQIGAQVHALSHFVAHAAAGTSDEHSLPHATPCDKCIAYAQFGSSLHATPPALASERESVADAPTAATATTRPSAQPYLARGPPGLV